MNSGCGVPRLATEIAAHAHHARLGGCPSFSTNAPHRSSDPIHSLGYFAVRQEEACWPSRPPSKLGSQWAFEWRRWEGRDLEGSCQRRTGLLFYFIYFYRSLRSCLPPPEQAKQVLGFGWCGPGGSYCSLCRSRRTWPRAQLLPGYLISLPIQASAMTHTVKRQSHIDNEAALAL
jgi:hypothetical protein